MSALSTLHLYMRKNQYLYVLFTSPFQTTMSNNDTVATRKLTFLANGQLIEIDLGADVSVAYKLLKCIKFVSRKKKNCLSKSANAIFSPLNQYSLNWGEYLI